MGYDNDDGYRIWDRNSNKILRSRDVVFNEKPLEPLDQPVIPVHADIDADINVNADTDNQEVIEKICIDEEEDEDSEHSEVEESEGRALRDRATLKRPQRFEDFVMSAATDMCNQTEPSAF